MRDFFAEGDSRRHCPPHLRKIIHTPHAHENGDHNRPLWIIWRLYVANDGLTDGPQLDCVCDSADLAEANVGAIFQVEHKNLEVFVERIPANHRFASSLHRHFTDASLSQVKKWR